MDGKHLMGYDAKQCGATWPTLERNHQVTMGRGVKKKITAWTKDLFSAVLAEISIYATLFVIALVSPLLFVWIVFIGPWQIFDWTAHHPWLTTSGLTFCIGAYITWRVRKDMKADESNPPPDDLD